MAYYNEFPHTRNYDSDLGFLIYQYKLLLESNANLTELYEQLLKIYEKISLEIKDITIEMLEKWLNDGTLFNIFKPYIDEMIADKLDKKLPYKDTKNNAYAVNEMIECILSYYYNNDKLFYDNNTALNDTIDSDGNRLAIDCSTLICLALNGVKYETSRYALGGNKYNNIPDYPYAVNIYDNGTEQFRRYANMVGKYFFDLGMAFTPNTNFSNLRTGDLLFWKGEPVPGSFLNISHVALFLNRTVDNKVRYIDANKGRVNVVSVSSTDIASMGDLIVLCARPDYNGINYIIGQNIVNGNQTHTINNTTGINYTTLSPLDKGYYTIIIKGTGDAPSVNSNGASLACTPMKNNLYVAYLRLESVSSNNIKIYVSNNDKTFNLQWVCVYKRFIENPYPFYVAPTIRGNRGKIRLDNDKTVPQSSSAYVLVKMESIVGNNISGMYHLSNDGCITIEESGTYLVNVGVANKSTTFANYRCVMFEKGDSTPTVLCQDNIIGETGHSTYKRMTFGYTFNAGERIGLQLNNTEDMTLLKGSFGTYIEVIKL